MADTWSSLVTRLEELRDPRCDDWWMMSSLWPTLLLSTSYYIIVRHAGPRFMKNRFALFFKFQLREGRCHSQILSLVKYNGENGKITYF